MRDAITVELRMRPYADSSPTGDGEVKLCEHGWVIGRMLQQFPNIDEVVQALSTLLVEESWRETMQEIHVCIRPATDECSTDEE